jgi:hypothetical protein
MGEECHEKHKKEHQMRDGRRMPRKTRKRTPNEKCEMNATKNTKKSTKCEMGEECHEKHEK